MSMYFGFDYAASVRWFEQATWQAPESALPYWGIALARGPDPRSLESDLRTQHLSLDVARTSRNAYGVVYEIEGPIEAPGGRVVRFCSVWQVDTGTDVPRFITMYPR